MDIKLQLTDKLIASGGFWSYDKDSVLQSISDEQLIEAALEKLDIDDINLLFQVFSARKIKRIWLSKMVPQGEYYYSLNRFYAWYYFNIRHPDRYLKSMMTRHLTRLLS